MPSVEGRRSGFGQNVCLVVAVAVATLSLYGRVSAEVFERTGVKSRRSADGSDVVSYLTQLLDI